MASATLSTPPTATFCMPSVAASTFSRMKGHICKVPKLVGHEVGGHFFGRNATTLQQGVSGKRHAYVSMASQVMCNAVDAQAQVWQPAIP